MSIGGKTAFTVMELLVVTTVIGILGVFLLMAISQARGKALRIQCVNNVRQLGVGLQAFVSDYNCYPLRANPGYYHGNYSEHNTMWMTGIQSAEFLFSGATTNRSSFLKWYGQGVWKCPAASRPSDWPRGSGYENYGYNAYGLSSWNDTNSLGLGGHLALSPCAPPVHDSEVSNPSDTMAIGDGFWGNKGLIGDGSWYLWRFKTAPGHWMATAENTKRSYQRHQGKANVVFCDGHAESPTLKYLFEDISDAALSRWNRDHQPHRDKF